MLRDLDSRGCRSGQDDRRKDLNRADTPHIRLQRRYLRVYKEGRWQDLELVSEQEERRQGRYSVLQRRYVEDGQARGPRGDLRGEGQSG